jgi:hypothetical protein
MSQNGTGRYIPVRTSTRKCQKVHTRTYSTAYRAVQGSTARYSLRVVHEMVQGSTGQSTTRYKAVHGGTCQCTVFICAGPRAGGPRGRPILVLFSNSCIDCTNSGFSFKSLHAQTRLFIPWGPCPRLPWHSLPLWHPRPPRGRLAMPRQATGDRGVAASSPYPRPRPGRGRGRPADGRGRPAGGRRRRRRRRVDRTSGVEGALDDLGLGTSARTRNLEDTVVVRDESAAQF